MVETYTPECLWNLCLFWIFYPSKSNSFSFTTDSEYLFEWRHFWKVLTMDEKLYLPNFICHHAPVTTFPQGLTIQSSHPWCFRHIQIETAQRESLPIILTTKFSHFFWWINYGLQRNLHGSDSHFSNALSIESYSPMPGESEYNWVYFLRSYGKNAGEPLILVFFFTFLSFPKLLLGIK